MTLRSLRKIVEARGLAMRLYGHVIRLYDPCQSNYIIVESSDIMTCYNALAKYRTK